MRSPELLGPFGPLARAREGYEHRPSQLVMADAIDRALESDGVALVEAGTGTGKTLAYLVPAILSGKKVIVSTGTKTLQDQIMEHDLPFLAGNLGIPFQAACMKGLSNYLCLRRYGEFVSGAESFSSAYAKHVPLLTQWRESTTRGDRAELLALPEGSPIWAQVQSGPDTRIGARCEHYDACFVTKMRREAEEADIIVVNHHLFFADLALRGPHGAGALPDYDAVIFDEAHQIEDIATEFFGIRVSTTRIDTLVRDADRALLAARLADGAMTTLRSIGDASASFFVALPQPRGSSEGGRHPLPPDVFTGEIERRMHVLDAALDALASYAKLNAGASEPVAQIARRTEQLRTDLAAIVAPNDRARVAWCELRGRSVSIGMSPVDVSKILRDEVWHRTRGAVLTSATLSTAGSFEFIKKRLGIDFDVIEHALESPFDFSEQAALYLPRDMPDPREPSFVERAAAQIGELVAITGGGAFVLCTSLRAMRELHARVKLPEGVPRLLQGEAPKASQLEQFRDARNAVLFATASFWEGVDVPGDALRLVVIDKLPFDVPTDPLVVARSERLREAGEEPFMKYVVPSAALALKQGFGRLIRTKTDRGVVAILDRRLTTKGYGKVFLKSLPPARRITELDEVRAFWRDGERRSVRD